MAGKKYLKRWVALIVALVFLMVGLESAPYAQQSLYMVQMDKTIDVTQTYVGQDVTFNYRLHGDDIVFESPKEIALVVDISGSMDWDINGTPVPTPTPTATPTPTPKNGKATPTPKPTSTPAPTPKPRRIEILKQVVKKFLQDWDGKNVKICIVPYNSRVVSTSELKSMQADGLTALTQYVDNLQAIDGTNTGDGMRVAYSKLTKEGDPKAKKYVITLTDGGSNMFSLDTAASGVSSNYSSHYYTDDSQGLIVPSGNVKYISNYDYTVGTDYAKTMGSKIRSNISFKQFVIGFATTSDLITNLNNIGASCGMGYVDGTNRYYYAGSETALSDIYNKIRDIISNDIPFVNAAFTEKIPIGSQLDEDTIPALESQGYDVSTQDVTTDGVTRKWIVFDTNLSLTRTYPDATTYPQNQTYRLKEVRFSIKVHFTTPGITYVNGSDSFLEYDDPFNNHGYLSSSGRIAIKVIQPVQGVEIGGPNVVGASYTGTVNAKVSSVNPTVDAITDTSIYDKRIKSWTIKVTPWDSTDPHVVNGKIAIADILKLPQELLDKVDAVYNGIDEVKLTYRVLEENPSFTFTARQRGHVVIQAESNGTNASAGTVTGTKSIDITQDIGGVQLDVPNTIYVAKETSATASVFDSNPLNMKINGWTIAKVSGDFDLSVTCKDSSGNNDSNARIIPGGDKIEILYNSAVTQGKINIVGRKTGLIKITAIGDKNDVSGKAISAMKDNIEIAQPVTSVTLPAEMVFFKGQPLKTINAATGPPNAKDSGIDSWSIDWDPGYVDVASLGSTGATNANTVTANNRGVARITAVAETAGYGIQAKGTCMVHVAEFNYTGAETMDLPVWQEVNISQWVDARVPKDSLGNPLGSISIAYTPDDSGRVRVNNNGVVTALKLGTGKVTVTATYAYNGDSTSKSFDVQINVIEDAVDIN